MNTYDPIDLLFGGMEKLGPGDDAETRHVLQLLSQETFALIVDAGCGVGRQSMVLARELGILVHAVDTHQPFLAELMLRSKAAGIGHLLETHCLDMQDISTVFQDIDLLWSEGAAYNIGVLNALTTWASAIRPNGFAVVSELSWLRDQVPERVREFFRAEYPAMQSVQQNMAMAEAAGYSVLSTHTIARNAWTEGYYDVLAPVPRR